MSLILLEKECGPKCRSRKHIEEIISVITHGSLAEFQAVSYLCYNSSKHSDIFGRTALHVAASCGKADILEWLLEKKKSDHTMKDFESGYTALHRAFFYGQLTCARLLIQYGSDIQEKDMEGYTPLDLATLDRPEHINFSLGEPNEVFTWGENNNSTLGHPFPHKRSSPEAVDFFRKSGISLKQVVLCKYHSVFLSHSGLVYTCGHGQGGRLGHEDQYTSLAPRLLETIKEFSCLEIAATTDHTLLRMRGGTVFTFGLNTYHQMGLTPSADYSLVPKQMNLKPAKGKIINGVCVGRFHSVVWTSDSLFTVGLNAGQLGQAKGDKIQSQLRVVSTLKYEGFGIALVACSDAATVCLTTKGDIYVLHEYQCRKIVSKRQNIEQLLVVGGTLDHNAGLDKLWEKGGQELQILMRSKFGELYLWRSFSPNFKLCKFSIRRHLTVDHVALTSSCLVLCTKLGEAFVGYMSEKKSGLSGKEQHSKEYTTKEFGKKIAQTRLNDILLHEEFEEIQVHRLPVLHRAVAGTADRKGENFAVIQTLPTGSLFDLPNVSISLMNKQISNLHEEADTCDTVHDAVLQLGERCWPVHRYILASRSDYLRNLIIIAKTKRDTMGTPILKVDEEISAEHMEQILLFIYTDTCDYLKIGHVINPVDFENEMKLKKKQNVQFEDFDEESSNQRISAFQAQQKQSSKRGKKVASDVYGNPVKCLQDTARRLGVKGLAKRLAAVKCVKNTIVSDSKNQVQPHIKFKRTNLMELCDVTIRADNNEELNCHKCILVARLEYFYSMLATGWAESQHSILSLPVTSDVLEILIDFLYSDEALQLRDSSNQELLCSVLIVSDQLLAWRLKEMCEVALANIISFWNVGELLEFSSIYNAGQLKISCQQFICHNLAATMEGRFLDVLSPVTIEELTVYYRNMISRMLQRHISRSELNQYRQELSELVDVYLNLEEDSQLSKQEGTYSRKGVKQMQKKQSTRNRQKSISDISDDVEKSLLACKHGNKSVNPNENLVTVVSKVGFKMENDKMLPLSSTKKQEKQNLQAFSLNTAVPTTPTQPEDVPKWTPKYKTLAWQSSSHSELDIVTSEAEEMYGNTYATSPTSLRSIMETESQSLDKKRSNSSRHVSWKDIKKQQSKREQNSQQHENGQIESVSPCAVTNPWRTPVKNVIKSFRDLMIQEETSPSMSLPLEKINFNLKMPPANPNKSFNNNSHNSAYTCWDLSSKLREVSSISSSDFNLVAGNDENNPWVSQDSTLLSPPTTPHFSAILKDEKEKTENLEQILQKPLALIQLEEQAMNELLQHYNSHRCEEQYITVERVSRLMDAPLWRRERKLSPYS